jgi:hypothetical protein
LLEASLFHRILKNAAGVVPNERARVWLGEERFPEGFVTPVEEITLERTLALGDILNATMVEIRGF